MFLVLFAVFYLAVYSVTARREASFLEETFGDAYRAYAERVPLLLPRPLPARSDGREQLRFSGARYLANKEWEAALGVVAGFAALAIKMWVF